MINLELLLIFFIEYSFLICFLGGFLAGEETIFILALFSAQGYIKLWIVFVFCSIGLFSADIMWFYIGRIKTLSKLKKYKIIHKGYKNSKKILKKDHDLITLILAKFIYGIGTYTIIYMGRNRKLKEFLKYNTIAILIWATVFTILGWFAGKGFYIVTKIYDNLRLGIFLLVLFVLIIYLIKIILSKLLINKNKKSFLR